MKLRETGVYDAAVAHETRGHEKPAHTFGLLPTDSVQVSLLEQPGGGDYKMASLVL